LVGNKVGGEKFGGEKIGWKKVGREKFVGTKKSLSKNYDG
jgi:hypothetical protein